MPDPYDDLTRPNGESPSLDLGHSEELARVTGGLRYRTNPPFVEVTMPAPLKDGEGQLLEGQTSIGVQISPHFHFPESAGMIEMAGAMQIFGESLAQSLATVFGLGQPAEPARRDVHLENPVSAHTACGLEIQPKGLPFVDTATARNAPGLVTCSACIDILEGSNGRS